MTTCGQGQPLGTRPAPLDVSIVLPIFNERGHLLDELDRIKRSMDESDLTYEIVLVDDGSTDGAVDDIADRTDIILIRHRSNRGSGAARRTGTAAARGVVVVWSDVDLTYPNDEIPALVSAMDGYDQVVGARRKEKGTLRLLRIPAKWFVRRLASYVSRSRIPDLNSGFRAFRKDVADQYLADLPDGFSCVTTLTMSFLCNGYSINYVPIDYQSRAGVSKFHWWRDTRRYILQVVRMAMSYDPLRIFLPLGTALAAVGSGKLVYDIIDKDWRPAANTLLIIFAALQTVAVGLLADLVVRTRHRPKRVE